MTIANEDPLRCPFKVVLVGVTFQCQQRYGHYGRCWNDPEGCGGDARITFLPPEAEKIEEMCRILREFQESK